MNTNTLNKIIAILGLPSQQQLMPTLKCENKKLFAYLCNSGLWRYPDSYQIAADVWDAFARHVSYVRSKKRHCAKFCSSGQPDISVSSL
eukprot:1863761-Amphidinium_carterae.1